MSTHAFIGYRTPTGFRGIYCNYDGYPSHVGVILCEHHNTMWDCTCIVNGSQIRNFDNDGTVVRYGDGTGDSSELYPTVEHALKAGYDYAYIFAEDGWNCYTKQYAKAGAISIQIPKIATEE